MDAILHMTYLIAGTALASFVPACIFNVLYERTYLIHAVHVKFYVHILFAYFRNLLLNINLFVGYVVHGLLCVYVQFECHVVWVRFMQEWYCLSFPNSYSV